MTEEKEKWTQALLDKAKEMSQSKPQSASALRASRSSHKTVRQPLNRAPLSMSWGSRFTIPQHIKDADPDHEYGFVPDGTEGGEDTFDRAQNLGWYPVTKEDNPALAEQYGHLISRKNKGDPYLRKGGQVMMRTHKEDRAFLLNKFEEQTRLQKEEAHKALELSDWASQNPFVYSQGVNFMG